MTCVPTDSRIGCGNGRSFKLRICDSSSRSFGIALLAAGPSNGAARYNRRNRHLSTRSGFFTRFGGIRGCGFWIRLW
jgi:hypothetical protein